jgi:hypothetical protein
MATKYAVLVESSYYVPGDERSKTNPGHGYPEHTVNYTEIIKFDDFAALQKWVECEESKKYGTRNYVPIQYEELSVKKKVEVTLS